MRETNRLRNRTDHRRDNNFTMIRFIATIFVFAGHMGFIRGGEPPFLAGFFLHEIGVGILFLIGGYLITQSWLSDPDPVSYSIRRFFRLWPPFAVMILIMVFVTGPLLSDLGIKGYFSSWYTLYLRNLRFFIVFAQPGVFGDLPLAYSTNGSLWTMPVEAVLYILTPFLLTALRVRRQRQASFRRAAILTGAFCVIDIILRAFFEKKMVVVYGTDLISAFHLIVLYIIGILFTYEQVRQYLNVQIGCLGMCVLFVFQFAAKPLQYILLFLIFPYFIFSLALASKPAFCQFGRRFEPSYGIFLYGFFFQQLMVSFQQHMGWNCSFVVILLLSAVPTFLVAAFSYYVVEKPMQQFGRFLIRKWKNRKRRGKRLESLS
ncbi:MAG: acyltransferase [Blautia sp.]|nr:acyltransferase [Blautia sp.]